MAAQANEKAGVCVVVGAGPGIGAAVAKKFAQQGYKVAIVSRKLETLTPLADELKGLGATVLPVTADATNNAEFSAALQRVGKELGPIEVLVYNASGGLKKCSIVDISLEDVNKCFAININGVITAMQGVLPGMVAAKKGTIIVTGASASTRGKANFATFAMGKMALRALCQSTAKEFGSKGVHVVHAIIDGRVKGGLDDAIDPAGIADNYWHVHTQRPTSWTFELDMRTSVENW